MNNSTILLVDDDKEILELYKKIFKLKGFSIITADNGEDAITLISNNHISVVITDIIMPRMDGLQLLNKIKSMKPEIEVIMLTAEGSIAGAVAAVKNGAFSYFVKPADIEELISSVGNAKKIAEMKEENDRLKQQLESLSSGKHFIGETPIAQEIRNKSEIIGVSEAAVLITGESGTGKEIVANLIHNNSPRNNKPFVCVNCAALNENLIESELFGSEKGAYTGAEKQRKGRFELANGGTIFFDEIGELSNNMQVKLLRVLQERAFERVGGTETIKSDFRLITATNRDLKKEVEEHRFREDLYYRINIIPIEIPPLRARKADIPLFCEVFLKEYSAEMNKKITMISDNVMEYMISYDWPGNVRELRNIIERLVVLAGSGGITVNDLPEELKKSEKITNNNEIATLKSMTKSFEKEYIIKVLKENEWRVSDAAEEMCIAKKNLYKKLNEYGIKYKQ